MGKSETTGLRAFDPSTTSYEVYHDEQSGEYWREIGWITRPATILVNMRTGQQHVEVIGCPNAERFRQVTEAGELEYASWQ